MGAILSLNFNPINFVITIVTNLAIFALGIVILSKMFNSENPSNQFFKDVNVNDLLTITGDITSGNCTFTLVE